LAGGGYCFNADNRDQSRNQAILDGSGFLNKTDDELFQLRTTRVLSEQLPTDAAACRCDNMTTARVAIVLKRALKFSLHFIHCVGFAEKRSLAL